MTDETACAPFRRRLKIGDYRTLLAFEFIPSKKRDEKVRTQSRPSFLAQVEGKVGLP